MAGDVPIRCRCGALRGTVHGAGPRRGNRLVCHCDDCQAYAFALPEPEAVVDAHGGTDIYQTSPARVSFEEGLEHLACLRLREGGLLRWYASCCQTPIANTMARAGMPFVGLPHCAMVCEPSRDAVLGPSRAGIFGRFAKDRDRLDAHDRAPLAIMLRLAGMILSARLRGDHQRSPFFDPASGAPIVVPRVLSADELAEAERARDAFGAA